MTKPAETDIASNQPARFSTSSETLAQRSWRTRFREGQPGKVFALCLAVVAAAIGLQALLDDAFEVTIPPQAHDIDQAIVSHPDEPTRRTVPLPDTWAARGRQGHGSATYQLSFLLDQIPSEPWAVQTRAMPDTQTVRLNGHIVSAAGAGAHRLPQPQFIVLPPALLHEGGNTLELAVSAAAMGGLSDVVVGPSDVLALRHQRDVFLRTTWPTALNFAAMLLSVGMLILRWRHRVSRLVGLIGAMALLVSLRNLAELSWPAAHGDPLLETAHLVLQVIGLGALVYGTIRIAGVGRASWLRWHWVLLPLLGLVAASASARYGLSIGSTALVTVLAWTAGIFMVAALQMPWRDRALHNTVMFSFGLSLLACLHDLGLRTGSLGMQHGDWLHSGAALGLVIACWALLTRSTVALNTVLDANAELEQHVEQRTRALQQASAAKSRFLAAASHDLRQPVATIGLLVGLLRDHVSEPRLKGMIDRIDQAAVAMEDLLRGLLDLSRLEAGTVAPRRERLLVQQVFDAIASHEGETARAKRLRLRFRPTDLAVESDPVLLDQILRNLVSNALRYTEYGGVLVACRRRGKQVVIQVWDTGVGIPSAQQDQVFEEFFQLDNDARDRTRGMGLGLAIVSRSAQLLGHPLTLRSRLGRGSCFSLTLPLKPAAGLTRVQVPDTTEMFHGLRVVVIEDDPGVRQALVDRLQHWGATVQSFEGQQALEAHLADQGGARVDLIVTDQRLPDGSGCAVIDAVCARQGETPAILVTGNTDPEDLSALAHRRTPVLHKPFRSEALHGAIRGVLKRQPAAA